MKTDWDYTTLANAYLKRPDYSEESIDKMLSIACVNVNYNGGGQFATSERAPPI